MFRGVIRALGFEQSVDLRRRHLIVDVDLVGFSRQSLKTAFTLFIQGNRRRGASIHGNDIDLDIADGNVENRFEFALNQQRPYKRALGDV